MRIHRCVIILFIGIFLLIFCNATKTSAENKIIDKRKYSETSEYALGFASRLVDGDYEHAFIIWFYSDSQHHRTVYRGAGFYPTLTEGKDYNLLLGVDGKVIDDSKEKIDKQLIVLVNKDTFNKALEVEKDYKNGETYLLGFNDCTTFVIEVAGTVEGLKVPNRILHLYPSNFISAMFNDN